MVLEALVSKKNKKHVITAYNYNKYLKTNRYKKMTTFGFIILRHVNNELTNKYWRRCYHSIRQFYPDNNILIIDDNSNYDFVTNEQLYNTKIIQSEFNKRGELLPYYYYLQHKLSDVVVILHDSVFIQQHINFDKNIDKYKFLWTFGHMYDHEHEEIPMLRVFNDDSLIDFYRNKDQWLGCFGAMTVITHDFLVYINSKYNLSKLLEVVNSRPDRSCFERVIAVLFQKEHKSDHLTLLGDIFDYYSCKGLRSFKPVDLEKIDMYNTLPLLKIWTGR